MRGVVVEILGAKGEWKPTGFPLTQDMPVGSLSLETPGNLREIVVFGWLGSEGPAVWRSVGGVDLNLSSRLVNTHGLEMLTDLTKGPWRGHKKMFGQLIPIRISLVP